MTCEVVAKKGVTARGYRGARGLEASECLTVDGMSYKLLE